MKRSSWIGQILGGRYRIDNFLGQGGMSSVYKAYDPNLGRDVAIKIIHPHLVQDPRFLARFEEEAKAIAHLRHPNIVQVFDFNHDEDLYYMVQEFLSGETLQERLRLLNQAGKHMPASQATGCTIDICDAAGYAHRRGMIHRDIKPANIMLDTDGRAILMDFGIVKITGSERHTSTGAVVGTALYMPPELIRGEEPDSRSDIYSLGVSLYETVANRPPFEADSAMSLMMKHLNDLVPDLRMLRPEVPEDMVRVIERALAKDRNDRFASMGEMAAALRAILSRLQLAAEEEIETQAGAQTLVEAPQIDMDSGPVAVELPTRIEDSGATLLAAQTMAEIQASSAGAGGLPEAPASVAAENLPEIHLEAQVEPPPQVSANEVEGATYPLETIVPGSQASRHWLKNPLTWVAAFLALVLVVAGGFWLRSAGQDETQAELPPAAEETYIARSLVLAPDGETVLTGGNDAKVRILKIRNSEAGPVLENVYTLEGHESDVHALAVTPDGRIAVSGAADNTVIIWDLAKGQLLYRMEGHEEPVTALVVTPDGRYAVSASLDSTIKVWDIENGWEVRTLRGHQSGKLALALAPDGLTLASGGDAGDTSIWRIDSGKEVMVFEGFSGAVNKVAITPDGTQVVSATDDGSLKVWDLTTGEQLYSLEGHEYGVVALALTPDGRYAVSGSHDNTLRVWDLTNGSQVHILAGHLGSVLAALITPDGKYALSGSDDTTIKMWDIDTGVELRTIREHQGTITGMAITPDGRLVVSAAEDGTVKVWVLAAE